MLKILMLFGSLTFVSFGIVLGQALLIKFARSVDFKAQSTLSIITNALQTPYLYGAVILYFSAVMTYLYISRSISFTALNLSVTGLLIVMTICADSLVFKQQLNWAHITGGIFMITGLGFMLLSTKMGAAIP